MTRLVLVFVIPLLFPHGSLGTEVSIESRMLRVITYACSNVLRTPYSVLLYY
jgi:hypothetical protein